MNEYESILENLELDLRIASYSQDQIDTLRYRVQGLEDALVKLLKHLGEQDGH